MNFKNPWVIGPGIGAVIIAGGVVAGAMSGNSGIVDTSESCWISGEWEEIPVNILTTTFNPASQTLRVTVHYDGMREDYPDHFDALMNAIPVADDTVITYHVGHGYASVLNQDEMSFEPLFAYTDEEGVQGRDLSADHVTSQGMVFLEESYGWNTFYAQNAAERAAELRASIENAYERGNEEYGEILQEVLAETLDHKSLHTLFRMVEMREDFRHNALSVSDRAVYGYDHIEINSSLRVQSWNHTEEGQFICDDVVYPIGGVENVRTIEVTYDYLPDEVAPN